MRLHMIALGAVLALVGCALDPAVDVETDEASAGEEAMTLSPDIAAQEVLGPEEVVDDPVEQSCGTLNTGAWGCHGDAWCNDRCYYRDWDFGWRSYCVQKPNHWETVCTCCDH